MEAKELRIGNWVKWPTENEPYEAQWEHGHWLGVFNKNYPLPDPVQLTEERLLKFGFKQDGNFFMKKYNQQGEFILFNHKTPVAISSGIKEDQFYYFFHQTIHTIKHVHHLQNLYFALTNEELEIKKVN